MLQISFEVTDKHKQRNILCSEAKLTIQEKLFVMVSQTWKAVYVSAPPLNSVFLC